MRQRPVSAPSSILRPSRRAVLGGGLAIGLGGLLGGCSPNGLADPGVIASGEPQSGGVLRIGIVGGGASDTVDGAVATNLGDIARAVNIYDTLFYRDDDYEMKPMLATAMAPNEDATVWTVTLREDVLFSDGRPLTADDVVASIERIIDPDDPKTGAASLSLVEEVRAADEHTVEILLSSPDAILDDALSEYTITIVPSDYDVENPIGTGPYMLESFTPAQSTILKANPHYWGDEGPYLDEIELLNFNDTDALINALLSTRWCLARRQPER